ncbi:MAG: hypothetical protein WAK26_15880 [Terracidiphilus sp.]
MEATKRDKLLARINRKDWWHVPPANPKAYQERGKFLASTFREAEFWGRPLDVPVCVRVNNPIIGDESAIETELLGAPSVCPEVDSAETLEWRWRLDARLKKAALAKGYDSIVLMSRSGYGRFAAEGKIPLSIELNLLSENLESSSRPEQ